MSAEIHKIGQFDSSPALFLDMLKANTTPDSIVVSIIEDGVCNVFWNKMTDGDKAFHLMVIQAELFEELRQ